MGWFLWPPWRRTPRGRRNHTDWRGQLTFSCTKIMMHWYLQDNMPNYKLTYFETAGRGESIKWIFALAGVDYVDEQLTWKEFPKRKAGEFRIIPTVQNLLYRDIRDWWKVSWILISLWFGDTFSYTCIDYDEAYSEYTKEHTEWYKVSIKYIQGWLTIYWMRVQILNTRTSWLYEGIYIACKNIYLIQL